MLKGRTFNNVDVHTQTLCTGIERHLVVKIWNSLPVAVEDFACARMFKSLIEQLALIVSELHQRLWTFDVLVCPLSASGLLQPLVR